MATTVLRNRLTKCMTLCDDVIGPPSPLLRFSRFRSAIPTTSSPKGTGCQVAVSSTTHSVSISIYVNPP